MDQLALFNVIDNTPMAPITPPYRKDRSDWKMGLELLDLVSIAKMPSRGVSDWDDVALGHGVIVGFNENTHMVQIDLPRPDGNSHIYVAAPDRLTKISG